MNYNKYILLLIFLSCANTEKQPLPDIETEAATYIMVLGTAQDGGYPHINSPNEFKGVLSGGIRRELVVSLGLIDKTAKKKYLFEATPDMPEQLYLLEKSLKTSAVIDGIFLTHAHMGHYTGLMYLGREAMGAKGINVYAMPRMKAYLEKNGPWSQLVDLKNIDLLEMRADTLINLTKQLRVIPFMVPHRDEFSETVGYKIIGPNKSALFIPDINKWKLWEKDIIAEVKKVDHALLDATFFADGEIPRPMAEIPHPFIEETVKLFENESEDVKSKIVFVHFNHSNPALNPNDINRKKLENEGYRFAFQGMQLAL